VVWKAGLGFELLELPAVIGIPPAPVDIRTALELEESTFEQARRLAQQGAVRARHAGLEATGLVVAEDPETPISDTIVRVARERAAAAVVLGEHAHHHVREVLLGSTSKDVLRHAPCPVLVVRHAASTTQQL
jgi:nucleotide-binding universal stress UspA family protein